jgi:hypothetical protein
MNGGSRYTITKEFGRRFTGSGPPSQFFHSAITPFPRRTTITIPQFTLQSYLPLLPTSMKKVMRKASCAEFSAPHDPHKPMCQVGDNLRLKLRPTSYDLLSPVFVNTENVRLFLPFTMSGVIQVQVRFEPLNLDGYYVLKVYDRRLMEESRRVRGNSFWSPTLEKNYRCTSI